MNAGLAGVRGAKDESGKNKFYWKGKESEEPVTEAELAEFKEGLAYAEAGGKAEAVHEFKEFLVQHPNCAFVPDAKKIMDMIKVEALETVVTAQQK